MTAIRIAIDLGYGALKAMRRGRAPIRWPAVVSPAIERKLDGIMMNRAEDPFDRLEITLDGETYFVGNLAIRDGEFRLQPLDENKIDHIATKLQMLMAIAALTRGLDTVTVDVVTGLPIRHFKSQKAELEKFMMGTYRVQSRIGQMTYDQTITVRRVLVFPQGLAALLAQVLDERGQIGRPDLAKQRVGVIDIGFGTTDFTVINNLAPEERMTDSANIGLSDTHQTLRDKLLEKEGRHFSLDEVAGLIKQGYLQVGRTERKDLGPWISAIYRVTAQKVANEVIIRWRHPQDLDQIFIAGEAGATLFEYLPLPNKQLVNQAAWANCDGYLKVAAKAWGPES